MKALTICQPYAEPSCDVALRLHFAVREANAEAAERTRDAAARRRMSDAGGGTEDTGQENQSCQNKPN